MITSASNARLKLVRKLAGRRQREKLGLFVCEGEDLVEAALDAGIEPVEVLVDAERPALADRLGQAEEVQPALMAELSTLGHPPRVIAVFRQADLPRGFGAPIGLGLWHVADPGNLGTLLRTADALGPAFVALSRGSADPTAPKALRASAGAVFRVPIGLLDEAPRPWFALVASGGQPLWEAEAWRGHIRPRSRARRASTRAARELRGAGDDSTGARGRVAERRRRRSHRPLRAPAP